MPVDMAISSYRIVEYDHEWPAMFDEEKSLILSVLGIDQQHVAHNGSPSVPGLGAKPILDIMVGIPAMEQARAYVQPLQGIGYECRGETVPGTLYIRKAAPRRYNVHMTEYGGGFWEEHLLFRDYLRAHQDVSGQYEALKRRLMAELGPDPDRAARAAYNDGKTAFIRAVVDKARSGRMALRDKADLSQHICRFDAGEPNECCIIPTLQELPAQALCR